MPPKQATIGSTFLGLCLSARRNMCIHPDVMARDSDREAVDSMCRDLTATWVRKRAEADRSVETCSFYEEYQERGTDGDAKARDKQEREWGQQIPKRDCGKFGLAIGIFRKQAAEFSEGEVVPFATEHFAKYASK